MLDVALIAFNTLQAVNGLAAVISRAGANCPATVVLGRTDQQAVTTNEATYSAGVQDVLVAVTDYKPGGSPVEPKDGDTLNYDEPGGTVTIELRPPNQGQKCFTRWRGGQVFRVHGKVISRS